MKKIIFLFTALILLNCSNDDSGSFNETDMKLVTGINIRNNNSNIEMQLGNPNILNNQLIIYPNPPSGILAIKTDEIMTDIWLVPANAQKIFQTTNFDNVLNSELYTESEINSNSELNFQELNSTNIQLDLQNLSSGYYKVFVKINGNIYWDNIFIPSNNFDFDSLINFWD